MNTRITFARTVNIGNFSNFKLGAERDLADGEVLEGAMRALESVVDALCDERYRAVTGGAPPATLGRPVQSAPAPDDGPSFDDYDA